MGKNNVLDGEVTLVWLDQRKLFLMRVICGDFSVNGKPSLSLDYIYFLCGYFGIGDVLRWKLFLLKEMRMLSFRKVCLELTINNLK